MGHQHQSISPALLLVKVTCMAIAITSALSMYVLSYSNNFLIIMLMLSFSTGMGGALPRNLMQSFVPRVGHLTSIYFHRP